MANERILRDKRTIPIRTKKAINYHYWYKPKTQAEFEELGREVLAYAQLPTSTNINRFCFDKHISPYRFKRLKNDFFKEMVELSKYIIADRNRSGVIERAFDKELYFKELRELDRDYREDEDAKFAKRVANAKEALGDITIIDHMLEVK
jgi:hypothetical protein